MKLAITGSSGFVGLNLCRILHDNGHKVIAVARSVKSVAQLASIGAEVRLADILEIDTLFSAFKGAEAIIHLAALFNHPEASFQDYYNVNVLGTHNVMKAAMRCEVSRVVHCSTVGVATGKGQMPFSELNPYSPPAWDNYETTKCEGEQAALRYHGKNNLDVTILRPAQVYGPGDVSKAKFYRLVKNGVIVNPGNTLKHLIYIDDLCKAFKMAAINEKAKGEIIIIGNTSSILLRDLIVIVANELKVKTPSLFLPGKPIVWLCAAIEKLCNFIKIKPPVFRRSMDFFMKSVEFNVSKAKELLSFEATMPIQEGVSNTAVWYRKNKLV